MALALPADLLERLESGPRYFEPGGHAIAYDIRGAPNGRPCFWFHGSPSCRFEGVLLDDFGRRHGHRFIASDRPGVGRSAATPGWSMISYAEDVVRLADHLGFDRFSVAGGSGGGPYVLALAATAPDRIDRAVSLACAGALEIDRVRDHIGWVDRLAAWAVSQPGLLPASFGVLATFARAPEPLATAVAGPFARWLPGRDARMATVLIRTIKEATANGAAGIVRDTVLLHRPWGFDVSSIRVPVDLVNGTADEFVPFAYGAELAERIPGCRFHTTRDADHFGTIFDFDRLRKLLG